MRRKSKKVPVLFVIVFIAAIILAILAAVYLPIPFKFKFLSFYIMAPAFSFAGIFTVSKITKKRGN